MEEPKGRSAELFGALLEAHSAADSPEQAALVEQLITRRFSDEKTIFITDMSGFTRGIRDRGFLSVVAMIYELRRLLREEIERAGGTFLKFEADNSFALFETPGQALEAALRCFALLELRNRSSAHLAPLGISVGIGSGPLFLVGDEDAFGMEVNLASKLGEDTGSAGEVLLTEDAYGLLTATEREAYTFEAACVEVSGVTIPYFKHCYGSEEGS
jgi:adenylate cyclase